MINQLTEELFARFVPYKIGNIVEYNRNGNICYGKIQEIKGRFADTKLDKKFEIHYRVNDEHVAQDSILRKVAEQ